RWVGVQCGIMDPYAVALSRPEHVLWIECKSGRYEHLPLDGGELVIAVVDSGIRRELAKGDFNQRVAECAQAFIVLRSLAPAAEVLCEVDGGLVEEARERLGPVLS